MKVKELLTDESNMKVKELLTDESKWTKFTFARDKYGNFAYFDNENAFCWCLAGAIEKCYPNFVERTVVANKTRAEIQCASISAWNDYKGRQFEEVKELVEKLDI